MFKKILLTFLTFIILSLSIVPSVHAQAPWYNQGIYDWYVKVYDTNISSPEEIFGERYTAAQVNWIIWSILTWPAMRIHNEEFFNCLLGVLFQQGFDLNSCIGSLLAYQQPLPINESFAIENKPDDQSLLSAVFAERSFSGITYIKERARKFNLIPEAQAQGFGFTTALEPFRSIWQVSRDISYGVFVIAAIVLAFMVMFRVKISPQTVVSVQSTIPKLIIALILITFSYAIAGFMVDLMYVAFGLLSLLGTSVVSAIIGADIDTTMMFTFLTQGSLIDGIPLGIVGVLLLYTAVFIIAFSLVFVFSFGPIITGLAAAIAFLGIGLLASTGIGATLLVIVFVILIVLAVVLFLWFLFKVWWTLIKAFVNIILLTIFAPFLIVLGILLPNIGFSKWLRDFVSNLAVFLLVGFLLMFSFLFLAIGVETAFDPFVGGGVGARLIQLLFGGLITSVLTVGSTPGWPPLLVVESSPTAAAFLYLIISAVIFSQIPKAAEIIKSFVAGRPYAYGTAIGEAVVAPAGLVWNVATSKETGEKWSRLTGALRRGIRGTAPS